MKLIKTEIHDNEYGRFISEKTVRKIIERICIYEWKDCGNRLKKELGV